MRTVQCVVTAILAIVFGGCAINQITPTPQERQALAPTGKLRVGLLSTNPVHVTRDPASGEFKGVAIDLGKELARRLGVPFEVVGYPTIPAFMKSVGSAQWDIAVFGFSPERAKVMDFSLPYMEVETGYLVPKGSSISALPDLDKTGVRIAVQEKGVADVRLSAALRNAVLVRASNFAGAFDLLRAGSADALAGVKPFLSDTSKKLPGSRILDGRISAESIGFAVAKGRDLTYIRKFVESAKTEGIVKAAIERAGLIGVVVAP